MIVKHCYRDRSRAGFTLVEMLVSMVILLIIIVLGFSALDQTSVVWRRSMAQSQAFQSARLGFDLMTRNLSQATLNTYSEYVDGQTTAGPYFASDVKYNGLPVRYARKSDLHFVCALPGTDMATGGVPTDAARRVPGTSGTGTGVFFQAPLGYTTPVVAASGTVTGDPYNGLATLLNAVGYFVEFGPDVVPSHVAGTAANQKSRYRLKQLLVPSDRDTVFSLTTPGDLAYDPTNPARWFTGSNLTGANGVPNSNVNAVADNVLLLVVRPEDPGTANLTGGSYTYDSHANERVFPQPATANQIPPILRVTMVAMDETSAQRLDQGSSEPRSLRSLLDTQVKGKKKFTDLAQYDDDLAALESGLIAARVNYRIFATAVPIRESKWTK